MSGQFITYDEYPAGICAIDLFIQKSPTGNVVYEYAIEFKYIKKKDLTPAETQKKFLEAKEQMDRYLTDDRIKNRPNLKKLIIVFSGFEVVHMEEIG